MTSRCRHKHWFCSNRRLVTRPHHRRRTCVKTDTTVLNLVACARNKEPGPLTRAWRCHAQTCASSPSTSLFHRAVWQQLAIRVHFVNDTVDRLPWVFFAEMESVHARPPIWRLMNGHFHTWSGCQCTTSGNRRINLLIHRQSNHPCLNRSNTSQPATMCSVTACIKS